MKQVDRMDKLKKDLRNGVITKTKAKNQMKKRA